MASTLRFDNWEDSNGTPILDGANLSLPSSAMPAGSVVQVVHSADFSTVSTTSQTYSATGLSASITPQSLSNKILVLIQANVRSFATDVGLELAIFKNDTIDLTSQGGGSSGSLIYDDSVGNTHNNPFLQILDSPSTTSSTKYGLYIASHNSGESSQSRGDWGGNRITLMEIVG